MPAGYTQVQDVGGGDRATVHGQRGDVPQTAKKTDTLTRLRSQTYRGIDDGTSTADASDGT